ncbi:MAG: type IX secretion system membrane protein PorP/SprF [Cytophagaceae bacterium]|nr:type IX secretion system membrane protein PorP/SprF [Cytophagaceae bacterium]MDW8455253.1 type IX secretion system membrane protein PorP/SprF [Cytophagaceae bacterium]
MKKYVLAAVGLFIKFFSAHGQDIQFSQFYAAPLYQNPAFAGSAHIWRFAAHNRLQWPGIRSTLTSSSLSRFTTAYISADGYSEKYKSGFGLIAMRDWQAGSTLASTEIGALYSYEIDLSPTFTLRPGLQASYAQRSIDYSRLRFPQDFNDQTGYTGNTYAEFGSAIRRYADISSGLLLYSDKLWGGLSFHHINRPNQSMLGEVARLPMKYAITGGYKFHLKDRKYLAYLERTGEVTLTPTIHYKAQGKSDQTDVGLYLIYDQLMAGLWYRGIPFKKLASNLHNNESIVILMGWKYEGWSIGYSYDFVVSKLATVRAGGAHELNITYLYNKSKHRKPMKRLPCPSLF